jgi:hypothetical protein
MGGFRVRRGVFWIDGGIEIWEYSEVFIYTSKTTYSD